MKATERRPEEPMLDFVRRWCHELRYLVRATTGEFDVDMSRYAMVLTEDEYAELCQERRAMLFQITPMSECPTVYGVRIVVSH